MARTARLVLTDTTHHVVARGVNGTPLFRHGFDKNKYLQRFNQIAEEEKVLIHGYCLMKNHVHWILSPNAPDGVARLIRRVHTWWAMWFNRRTKRTGHLFQSRYHSSPLSDNHYWTALRYVEVNPCRAKLVKKAEDWEHSSARAHVANLDPKAEVLVKLTPVKSYRNYSHAEWQVMLAQPDPESEKSIRRAQHSCKPCGSEDWIKKLEKEHDRPLAWGPPGRPKKQIPAVLTA